MREPITSTIRDALQGEALADFDASQFVSLGGQLYYSLNSAVNQVDVNTLVSTFQAVHLPTFGQFIPQSGEFSSATVADTPMTLIEPSDNEVYGVTMIGMHNQTLGSLDITLTLSDAAAENTIIISEQTITAGEQKSFSPTLLGGTLLLDSNAKLTAVASGASIDVTAYIHKVVQ
jgi:hypothetical protein